MASYKDKVAKDLDRWIAAGLVNAEQRAPILDTIPDARRLDAATALAWVGGTLLGIAAIAFTAANWDDISRLARFAIILSAFALAAGGAAWAAHKGRALTTDIALTIAALLFGAAIGLTGQIFDITGDPRTALNMAGIGAAALALAGRSVGAAIAALLFFGAGDLESVAWFGGDRSPAPWLLVFAPLGAALALHWRSAALAHVASIGMLFAVLWLAARYDENGPLYLLFSIVFAAGAGAARWMTKQDQPHASVFYGWATLGAVIFFAISGYIDDAAREGQAIGIVHRLAWLAGSGALIALGRFDKHLIITGIGVVSLFAAVAALLGDLGLDLMAAAGLFFLCAMAALIGGLVLRRKPKVAT